MPEICTRCGFDVVVGCQANGTIKDADDRMGHCPNMTRKLKIENIRDRLEPDLLNAPSIKASPLYTPSVTEGPPTIDMTSRNLLIEGVTRSGFLPHLKLALVGKFWTNPKYQYKMVGDARLRDVYVGNESFKNRTPTAREKTENNNAIADIVGESYDLVIILLGTLAYKNVAAPGILREALMHREMLGKPTWVFSSADPAYAWTHSKDADVELFLERFEVVRLSSKDNRSDQRYEESEDITVDDGKTEPPDLNALVEEYEEVAPPSPRKAPKVRVQEPEEEPEKRWPIATTSSDELAGPGGGPDGNRKKKYGKGRNW